MSAPRTDSRSLETAVADLDALAGDLLAEGAEGSVSVHSVQKLLTIAVKLYVARRVSDPDLEPFHGDVVTATDVAVVTTQMLRAVNLELFELSLWNGWGRA